MQEELAALLSLILGVRLKAGGITRNFDPGGDVRGTPRAEWAWTVPSFQPPQGPSILPWYPDHADLDDAVQRFMTYPHLEPMDSIALVRAARAYQDALWLADSLPELAWLLLVSAVETAAERWDKGQLGSVELLHRTRPELASRLKALASRLKADAPTLFESVADELKHLGAGRRFRGFILQHLPAPPEERPPDFTRVDWENMKKPLDQISKLRSEALHAARPFPAPLTHPPSKTHRHFFQERPFGISAGTHDVTWPAKVLPMQFHVFEYIVRQALLTWWESLTLEDANYLRVARMARETNEITRGGAAS